MTDTRTLKTLLQETAFVTNSITDVELKQCRDIFTAMVLTGQVGNDKDSVKTELYDLYKRYCSYPLITGVNLSSFVIFMTAYVEYNQPAEITSTDAENMKCLLKRLISDMKNLNYRKAFQLRAVFTAYCRLYSIEADTYGCNRILLDLFTNYFHKNNPAAGKYSDFEDFMVSHIV